MKTSYYLVTAVGLITVGVILYAQLPGSSGGRDGPGAPTAQLAPDPPASLPIEQTDGSLPPIPVPLDGQLVIAAGKASPPGDPSAPLPLPAVPLLPSQPLPGYPSPPAMVAPPPAAVLPQPAPLPIPAVPPQLPKPGSDAPPTVFTGEPAGKFVVIKGNKLIEGSVLVAGDKALIRHGSLDRVLPKADVLFVAETKDQVYRFMLAQVYVKDVPARLGVARWCMFTGMREQALTEAREILKLRPTIVPTADTARSLVAASDMVRSLEESLRDFPGDGSTQAIAKPTGGTLVAVEPEPDVTPEGATSFAAHAQPVLANQCMECHARADYPGTFKLIRITGFEIGPQSTNANLRATVLQLKKDDPVASPLLAKALTAHGGMKQPAFVSRQAAAFRALEGWVLIAACTAVQPMTAPAQPLLPPSVVIPPMPAPSASPPVLPPVEQMIPIIPPAVGSSARPMPTTVPIGEVKVPIVLPTPPSIPSPETFPKPPAAPANPQLPTIPPAVSLPKLPGSVQPASGSSPPSQFGTAVPPKPEPSGPAGGDEFDANRFNYGK